MAIKTSQLERGRLNLREPIKKSFEGFFSSLKDESPTGLYNAVVADVEKVLLNFILNLTGGNQTQATKILGLWRHTVRRKIELHNIDCSAIRKKSQKNIRSQE